MNKPTVTKAAALWSGGKDSCFACYKVIQENKNYKISALLNFIAKDKLLSLSHGLRHDILREQLRLTNIPFLQKEVPTAGYEEVFKKTITDFKKEGIEAVVFGDIYLREHRDWIEEVCRELNVKPIFPLWEKDTAELVREFVNVGFKAIVVAVKKHILTPDWLGRVIDKDFVSALKKVNPDIDPCGEKGEFHTLIVEGPILSKSIKLTDTEVITENGSFYLKIKEYKTVPKAL